MNMYSDLSIQLNSYPLTWSLLSSEKKIRVTLLSLMDSGYKTYNDQCDSVMIPVAQKLRVLILFQEYRIPELAKSGNICDSPRCMSWGANGRRRYSTQTHPLSFEMLRSNSLFDPSISRRPIKWIFFYTPLDIRLIGPTNSPKDQFHYPLKTLK